MRCVYGELNSPTASIMAWILAPGIPGLTPPPSERITPSLPAFCKKIRALPF